MPLFKTMYGNAVHLNPNKKEINFRSRNYKFAFIPDTNSFLIWKVKEYDGNPIHYEVVCEFGETIGKDPDDLMYEGVAILGRVYKGSNKFDCEYYYDHIDGKAKKRLGDIISNLGMPIENMIDLVQ